jgi:hypothetical protein
MSITILRPGTSIVNRLKPGAHHRYFERGRINGRQRLSVNCAPGSPCPSGTEALPEAQALATGADRAARRWAGYNEPETATAV